MLQLSYRGSGALAVDDVPAPVPGPGEVRVRVHSTGLCMSDVYGVSGVNDRRDVVLGEGDVLVMGHEVAGHVELGGPGAGDLAPGTPVAIDPIAGCGDCPTCRAGDENLCDARTVYGCTPAAAGGYAEAVVVPRRKLHVLAPGTPIEVGALVEPLSVGAHAVRLAAPAAGDAVLVIGGGIIGIGAALAARRRIGAVGKLLVLEPRAERRALCEALGLRAAAPDSPVDGFDLALDCVARPETFANAVQAVRPQGLVMLVGIFSDEIPLPVSTVVWRETRIAGSFGYSDGDFADVAQWVGSGAADLAPLVQQRVGFDGLTGAFEDYASGALTAVRTLFQPGFEQQERT
ncbi:zinc-binding dehydrogenase [Conexibacter sp. CPCC 206217]|uniref:zinc-dependent alcohol dehydrogenase n=1 Tax=Conexibacter sp. CPCC 206217 TaxID=3064574 RepID=UPI0027229E27|nr:alcohol dehydrogenase catalytic domain-containing protein [Conexibacter sp. CPCC 206217]MDO8212407.1 alcohol dehydrogenase catalytic domain-containing protein [Conexibacter sp. CPCC 206217]